MQIIDFDQLVSINHLSPLQHPNPFLNRSYLHDLIPLFNFYELMPLKSIPSSLYITKLQSSFIHHYQCFAFFNSQSDQSNAKLVMAPPKQY